MSRGEIVGSLRPPVHFPRCLRAGGAHVAGSRSTDGGPIIPPVSSAHLQAHVSQPFSSCSTPFGH
jgi:hypothetical protein